MLARRQIYIQKDNLVCMCRISVKSLLDYACLYTQVDDDCEEFINFCAVFEQVVLHRLRPYQKKVWLPGQGSPRHFWDVLLENCNRTRGFQFQTCIPNIEAIETIKSPKAKLRAFIRVALMEKRLSDYLYWLLANTSLIRECYLDGAIFASEEASVLCGDLIGLNAIDFNFCLKGNENELLGPLEISYAPFLKYKQNSASRCHDDIEMLRLSGKDDDEDIQPGGILTESNINDVLRLHDLEKHVRLVKEQKDYLEELARLRERQVNEVNIKMENMKGKWEQAERDKEQERRTMDACVLELQAEIIRLCKQNDSLRNQVASLKQFKQRLEMAEVPMIEMATGEERVLYRSERDVDVRQLAERPSMARRNKSPPQVLSDQKSIVSLLSDNFLLQEDSQSMVPLAGSLADINVAGLEPQESSARVEIIVTQTSLNSGEKEADIKNMKLSSIENAQDQYQENALSFHATKSFKTGMEKTENNTAKSESDIAGSFEVYYENVLQGKIDVSEVDSEPERSVTEPQNKTNHPETENVVSESYVLMENNAGQIASVDSIPYQDHENCIDLMEVKANSTNLNVESAQACDIMAVSGNSTSSGESEKEEELVMSEPEVINHGNTSSDSDAAWEVVSDPEHGENKEEN